MDHNPTDKNADAPEGLLSSILRSNDPSRSNPSDAAAQTELSPNFKTVSIGETVHAVLHAVAIDEDDSFKYIAIMLDQPDYLVAAPDVTNYHRSQIEEVAIEQFNARYGKLPSNTSVYIEVIPEDD